MILTQTISQKKTAITWPANSQLQEITQEANAENDNLLDVLPEETSSGAPSVSLTKLLEQTTEMPSCSSSSSDISHAKKDLRVATVKQQQLAHPAFYYCVVEKGWLCKTCISFSGISSPGVHYQSWYIW